MADYRIFNRALLARRRQQQRGGQGLASHPLHQMIQEILLERLSFVQRSFETVAFMGDVLLFPPIQKLFPQSICLSSHVDSSAESLIVIADSEFLPLKFHHFDLIISYFDLQAINDVPGALLQIRQALKPDGLFLGTFLGGESLWELKEAWMRAEEARRGGVSPRVAPMISVHDAALLMQRAGFGLPVIDHESTTHLYENPQKLFQDLQFLQLSNVLYQQEQGLLGKKLFQEAQKQYKEMFSVSSNTHVVCTYDVLFLSGWGPSDSQQRPLIPGSGKIPLERVL